jgi:beta-hydroxylase
MAKHDGFGSPTRRFLIRAGWKIIQALEKLIAKHSLVGNDITNWEEGKSIIFDDTYMHEVWNDTEGERAVLFMDVVRPLRFPVSALNKFIIWLVSLSVYVQDAKKFHEAWEKRFDQIVAHS